MLKTIIVLPDGTELSSGAGTNNAIVSAAVTTCVNAGQELTLGSCCAAMLEAKLLTPGGNLSIGAGQELTVYREDKAGNRRKVGLFTTQKPVCSSANSMTVTAFDRIVRLDRDLTRWLKTLDQWPYTVKELAEMVCAACELELVDTQLPNGSCAVTAFTADGITGRQLMQWIGQLTGRFCRATPDGRIEFAWYTPASVALGAEQIPMVRAKIKNHDLSIQAQDGALSESGDDITLTSAYLQASDDGKGNMQLILEDTLKQQYAFQNSLCFADYAVAPAQKVQLRKSQTDVGTVYPSVSGEVNTYIITANPLLSGLSQKALQAVAQTLYAQLSQVTYTPCRAKLPAGSDIQAGHILTVTDRNGKKLTSYIMTVTQNATLSAIESTGSARRESTTAVNSRSYESLSGKVLNLRTDIDGIRAENADNAGKFSRLELDVSGIRGQVEKQEKTAGSLQTKLTALEQTAESISAKVKTITETGVSKVTTEFGLSIDGSAVTISRSDSNMENKLSEKGMYILRDAGTGNETVMLRADADGVLATDVAVRNYLIVGDHARFEDYGDKRTACFYIGG